VSAPGRKQVRDPAGAWIENAVKLPYSDGSNGHVICSFINTGRFPAETGSDGDPGKSSSPCAVELSVSAITTVERNPAADLLQIADG
jgi:hypothetical protein